MALTTILPSGLNSANDFSSLVPAAYSTANASFIQANSSYTAQNITAAFANSAFSHANAAYAAANTGGGGGGGASVTVGSIAPSPAANGYLWYDDTTTGELFVYVNDPAITGPNQANEATTQTYTISNYNGAYAYIIGVTGGSVTRTNQSIYWTMPSVTTNTTHYMTTQVVSGGVTSAVDTRTVLVVDLNIDDTSIIVTDFSFNNLNSGWVI